VTVETYSLGNGGITIIILSQVLLQHKTRTQFSILFDIWLSSHEAVFLPSYMEEQLVNAVYVIIQVLCLQQRTDEI